MYKQTSSLGSETLGGGESESWRLQLGARPYKGGVSFRVWAPKRHQVEVVFEGGDRAAVLTREDGGYFSALVAGAGPGSLYRYRLDGDEIVPDPCSRFQPQGPHGPSLIVDPDRYAWNDQTWGGVRLHGQILYELHVGAFTREGTWDSAAEKLPLLRNLGVTVLEIMPIAEWEGRWNWGYDGVDLFAPSHHYGDYEALKRFVDRAHGLGLGVILDVVYNHVGPDGNYLNCFSDDYFTDRYKNDWGAAINYDGPNCDGVREFFIQNACYWISEFHLDGLRLDATQDIYDGGPVHVLAELSRRARSVAGERAIVLIAENEPQDVRCLAPIEAGGYGLDGMWNDDFHHASRVALTGRREAYLTDYQGIPREFIACVKRGFLFQGQYYSWQKKRRGTQVTREPASAFVCYLQNHDQTANCIEGRRLGALVDPAAYRALTALLLLAPETPLLFMGQEFAASVPWVFFADHKPDLAKVVLEGRKEFLSQFPSYASPEAQQTVPDPAAESTFNMCKLDWGEREAHAEDYALHRDLLRLRRQDAVLARQSRFDVDGAVLAEDAFVLRFFGGELGDRLLLVNLGAQRRLEILGEPLLAPLAEGNWHLLWSSDARCYGGPGIVNPYQDSQWTLPGRSAAFFSSNNPAPSVTSHS
jgi:maltooligosyltrehalose trehalohydrolase